jgi:hypothetical protein
MPQVKCSDCRRPLEVPEAVEQELHQFDSIGSGMSIKEHGSYAVVHRTVVEVLCSSCVDSYLK